MSNYAKMLALVLLSGMGGMRGSVSYQVLQTAILNGQQTERKIPPAQFIRQVPYSGNTLYYVIIDGLGVAKVLSASKEQITVEDLSGDQDNKTKKRNQAYKQVDKEGPKTLNVQTYQMQRFDKPDKEGRKSIDEAIRAYSSIFTRGKPLKGIPGVKFTSDKDSKQPDSIIIDRSNLGVYSFKINLGLIDSQESVPYEFSIIGVINYAFPERSCLICTNKKGDNEQWLVSIWSKPGKQGFDIRAIKRDTPLSWDTTEIYVARPPTVQAKQPASK